MTTGFKILFFISLMAILFTLGTASMRWNVTPAGFLNKQFDTFENIWKELDEKRHQVDIAFDINEALKNKTVIWNQEEALQGYTAMVVRYQNNAYIMDMDGKVMHEWIMPFSTAFPTHSHVKSPVSDARINFEKIHIFPNGDLLAIYHAWGKAPYGYGMIKMDKNSKLLWTLEANTHHDFYVSPDNGHIFALTQAFSAPPASIAKYMPSNNIFTDSLIEVSSEGQIISSTPLLDPFLNSPYKDLLFATYDRDNKWDITHANSIERLEPAMAGAFPQWPVGSLLISMRNISTVAVINPERTKVLWAYNGLWKNQHAAHFTKDGTILLFDNRGLIINDKEYSRILEINPNNLAVTFEYDDLLTPFYNNSYGRVQRLDNGNTLITQSLASRVFEINPTGKIVWEMKLPKMIALRFPEIPFPAKGKIHSRYQQDFLGAVPNLATVIVFSERYTPEQLPFLTQRVD